MNLGILGKVISPTINDVINTVTVSVSGNFQALKIVGSDAAMSATTANKTANSKLPKTIHRMIAKTDIIPQAISNFVVSQ